MKANAATIIKVKRGIWDIVGFDGKVIFTGTKKQIADRIKSQVTAAFQPK